MTCGKEGAINMFLLSGWFLWGGGSGESVLWPQSASSLEEGKLENPAKTIRYINYENLTHMKRGGGNPLLQTS